MMRLPYEFNFLGECLNQPVFNQSGFKQLSIWKFKPIEFTHPNNQFNIILPYYWTDSPGFETVCSSRNAEAVPPPKCFWITLTVNWMDPMVSSKEVTNILWCCVFFQMKVNPEITLAFLVSQSIDVVNRTAVLRPPPTSAWWDASEKIETKGLRVFLFKHGLPDFFPTQCNEVKY